MLQENVKRKGRRGSILRVKVRGVKIIRLRKQTERKEERSGKEETYGKEKKKLGGKKIWCVHEDKFC